MYSIVSIIFMHLLVNIGMTIGLLPVIGIPLPLISYGGSSMLTFSVMIAMAVKLDSARILRAGA
jgi:rod shape determining protein RodA